MEKRTIRTLLNSLDELGISFNDVTITLYDAGDVEEFYIRKGFPLSDDYVIKRISVGTLNYILTVKDSWEDNILSLKDLYCEDTEELTPNVAAYRIPNEILDLEYVTEIKGQATETNKKSKIKEGDLSCIKTGFHNNCNSAISTKQDIVDYDSCVFIILVKGLKEACKNLESKSEENSLLI